MGIVVSLTEGTSPHPNKDALEGYALGRLPEMLAAPIEEHLLLCHACQDAVEEEDNFVFTMKSAAREPTWTPLLQGISDFATSRAALASLVVLCVVTVLIVGKHPPEPFPQVPVSLSSLRGLDPLSPAPAGRPLLLTIESPDLAPSRDANSPENGYRVEVVNSGGQKVWEGAVTESGGKFVAPMSKPLDRGVYWVRFYGKGRQLLREFGISAK